MRGLQMSDEKDLGNRVCVLESKQDEYARRQSEQENRTKKQETLTNQIAESCAVMQNTLTMLMEQVLPKVRKMECEVMKNTTFTKAALWVTGAVIAAGISAIVAMI